MQKVLFIGKVWPEPTSSAAGKRILQLVDLFIEENFEITFASTASKSDFSYSFINQKIKEQQIILNNSSFDELVQQLQPQVVVFDRFMTEEQFGWRVREFCPDAITILDTEDLHFLRNARENSFNKKIDIDVYTTLAKREIAAILRCDLSLLISKKEVELLVENYHIPSHISLYLPFLENIEYLEQQNLPPFKERNDFVFIGNFLHEPNYQTVLQLKKEIWPILSKEIHKAELHIYGAYTTQKILQLNNNKERFIIKGRTPNAHQTISQYKVLLAPIPFGAGIKGKFIDAIQTGTPSVTSSIGAESMDLNGLWNGFVTDDYTDFIQKSKVLYQDELLWNQSQQNGFKILKELFDIKKFKPVFWNRFHQIQNNIKHHRNSNFIGEILKTQLYNSQKYMSLWIETKNKI